MTITSEDEAPVVVTWTEPVATDDSGVTPVLVSTHTSGAEFEVGEPSATVTYTATDAAGNEVMQSFTISVIVGKCMHALDFLPCLPFFQKVVPLPWMKLILFSSCNLKLINSVFSLIIQ